MPYNPPNPYGSYYTFDQPGAIGQSSFMNMPGGQLSASTMSALGFAQGGFNPTPMEYLNNKVQTYYQQQWMASQMRNDARSATMSNAFLQMLYGNNLAGRNQFLMNWGGIGNLNEAAGAILSLPGISDFVGGSPLSLGLGGRAMATSGMLYNNRQMFGGTGPMMQWAGDQITANITKRFFPGGMPNLAMTQGLNRDQIGGIQAIMAGQGALGGWNMMNFDKGPQLDEATMDRITNATKNAAKVLGSIMEIYGDKDITELARKAQMITGLAWNQLGNPELMAARMAQLRQQANFSGMDMQSMMDLSAGAVQAGLQYGLRGQFLHTATGQAVMQGRQIWESMRANAGALGTTVMPQQSIVNSLLRDQGAMLRDPVGLRRVALMMAIEEGHIRGPDVAAAEQLMAMGGAESVPLMNAFMQDKARISMMPFVNQVGLPAMQEFIRGPRGARLFNLQRTETMERARISRALELRSVFQGADPATLEAMLSLGETFSAQFLSDVFAASPDRARAMISGSPLSTGTNKETYLGWYNQAITDDRAQSMMRRVGRTMAAGPWISGETTAAKFERLKAEQAGVAFTEGNRGGMTSGGMIVGLMRGLGYGDQKRLLLQGIMFQPENMAGLTEGLVIDNPTRVQMQRNLELLRGPFARLPGGSNLMKALGISGTGPVDMADLQERLTNIMLRHQAFTSADMFTFTVGGKLAAGANSIFEDMRTYGNEASIAKQLGMLYEAAGESVSYEFSNVAHNLASIGATNQMSHLADLSGLIKGRGPTDFLTVAGAANIEEWAKSSSVFRQGLGQWVSEMGPVGPAEKEAVDKLKGIYDLTAPPAPGTQTISGVLTWEDKDKLRLKATLVPSAHATSVHR